MLRPVIREMLLHFVLFALLPSLATSQNRGIPGTTQTLAGYDTELGTDPICWTSVSTNATTDEVIAFPNPLVQNFSIAGGISLLRACPSGNTLTAEAPVEVELIEGTSRGRLRTGQYYDYSIQLSLNLTSLDQRSIVSDMGPAISFQVLACVNGNSGFCSPFIHEESKARLVAQGMSTAVARGDRHGGTHVHSPRVFSRLDPTEGPTYNIQVKVPMIINNPGDFFVIAAIQFFTGESDTDIRTHYDMGNALVLGQRLISYQAPVELLEVSHGVLMICHAIRGVAGLIILFLIGQTIYHRQHQVLKLSQQPFLIVFLVGALAATLSTLLIEPRNDFYCRWNRTAVLTSLQLVIAVLGGRLWRINAVISPLLVKTLRRKESSCDWGCLGNIPWRPCGSQTGSVRNIRKEVQPWQLTAVVAILTLPQVILQVAAAIWQEEEHDLEYNPEESIARTICTNHLDVAISVHYYGFYCFLLGIVFLLVMAHSTRHLPSLFNETEVILSSALTSILLLILGLAVIVLTDEPTTSPSVPYLTEVLCIVSITLNVSLRIMLPKLRMVWRGETVIVSNLVSDHTTNTRKEDELFLAGRNRGVRVTGLRSSKSGHSTQRSNSVELAQEMENFSRASEKNELEGTENELYRDEMLSVPEHEEEGAGSPGLSAKRSGLRKNKITNKSMIRLRQDKAPARRLVLKMFNLQKTLSEVNSHLMSGKVVSKENWERVRLLTCRLGETFADEVTFDWSSDEGPGDVSGKVLPGENLA